MSLEIKDELYTLKDMLDEIPDPREKRGIRYKHSDLLLLMIYAILSGFSTGVDISDYVELNFDFFQRKINLRSVPSHDTFLRILRITDFDHLANVLSKWLQINYPEIYKEYNGYKVLHIDGKSVRAASEKSKGEAPIYLLNSQYEGSTISVYSKRIGEKTNELGEIPDFLDMFDLEKTIVTIDAIGTNKKVIDKILSKNGNYLFQVKENQEKLYNCIKNEVQELENKNAFNSLDSSSLEVTKHGRCEKIRTTMIKDTSFIYEQLGLKSFYGTIAHVAVYDKHTEKIVNGEEEISDTRAYLITNLETLSVENMQNIKLSHWNLESQHWILDVQMNEDHSTARRGFSVENASALKKFCLRIKKYDEKYKDKSMKMFQYRNSLKIEELTELLFRKMTNE